MKHICAWPNCKEEILNSSWMCGAHWFNLPWGLRANIYETYVCDEPTADFEIAEKEVRKYVTEHYPETQRV